MASATAIWEDFQRRGLLWKTSLKHVSDVRDKLALLGAPNAIMAQLDPYYRDALEAQTPGTSTFLDRSAALKAAKLSVLRSEEYALLTYRWSDSVRHSLSSRIYDECPPDLLDELLEPLKTKSITETDWYNEVTLDELQGLEKRFWAAVSSLPLGVNYVESVMGVLIKFHDEGHKTFVVLRANTIEDLLETHNPLLMPNFGSEIRGHVMALFRHLAKNTGDIRSSSYYAGWYDVTCRLAMNSDILYPIVSKALPAPSQAMDVSEYAAIVELTAAINVALIRSGVPNHVSEDLMRPIMYGLLHSEFQKEPATGDTFIRKFLWGAAGWAHSPQGPMSHLAFAFDSFVKWVDANVAPFGFVQSLSNVVATIGVCLFNVLDRLLEVIFMGFNDYTDMNYRIIAEYYYASRSLLSGLLPESRRRPKSVWALLFQSNFTTLTPAERFALGCNLMETKHESPLYSTWGDERLQSLRDYGADVEPVAELPIRGFKIPKIPTVANRELAALAPLMPETTQVNEIASNFVQKLHQMGVPPGIDGTWFATTDRLAKSIGRYNVTGIPEDELVRTKVLRAAHALADKYPMMYKNAQYLTPAAAINKIKVKYSPGLPHIPRVRDRKELKRLGVFDAMVSLTEQYLRDGVHPGSMAHCFVKSDIVSLDKLLKGKNIRTIVAADLISNLIQYCTTVEVTRRQPPIDAFIMNAVPRTEGGFRPFYEKLATFKDVIMADASEFDSKLPPVFSVDGLAELRSIGYDGSLIKPITDSQIWSSYIALRYAGLINLADGAQLVHTQGLMTGQGNTGVDNRDAFRLVILTGWSVITGKDPSEFWEDNIIGNAGDDDAIGTNTPDIWPEIIQYISKQFGMTINIEAQGFSNLALVGLRPIPVPEKSIQYYSLNSTPLPNFAIAGDRHALLAKRTEYRIRAAGFSDIAFLMRHIDGIIGSAYLTAHLHDVYDLLTNEYLVEMQQILLRFYDKVVVSETFDSEGDRVGVLVELGSERPRYAGRTQSLRKWLKSHRFPNYAKIMEIALKPQDTSQTKMAKDHSKLLTWNPTIPMGDKLLFNLLRARETLVSGIPNHVARALPEFKGLDPTYLLRNPNYSIAKFVWLSMYHKAGKKVPKAGAFLTVLKENPYGSAEDGIGFLNWLTNSDHLDKLVREDLEHYRAQMMFITIIYFFVEDIFKSTRNIPVLSILFNLYALTMRDVNRLYSFLNYFHFIATGRSSPVISNMMPPDPYAWVKQFAVILSIVVPRKALFYLMPGLRWVVWPLPKLVEYWAAADSLVSLKPFRTLYNTLDIPAPWAATVGQFADKLLNNSDYDPILVCAPTGTGKSTALVGTLLQYGFSGTIWILCPTIVARDAYDNPFIVSGLAQILMAGVTNQPERRVKALTYGHANVRLIREAHPHDLVIFDEQHLGQTEMWQSWYKFHNWKRMGITATPVPGRMPRYNHIYRYPLGKRFEVAVTRTNLAFPDLVSVLATEKPHLLSRALIVAPTRSKVTQLIQTLGRLSLTAHELSSEFPEVPATGIIVATTIVDTAITIQPPPSCLIDLGETVSISYDTTAQWVTSSATILATGPSAHTQRSGRVGRHGDSVAFVAPKAGTGPEPEPLVTPFGLLYDETVAESLIRSYGVHNPLTLAGIVNKGMLRYITLAPDVAPVQVNVNSWALAKFVFQLGSMYMILEDIRAVWLDLRVERSIYELYNILVQELVDNNMGDPLLGDWNEAVQLLGSGFLGVHVRTSHGSSFRHCTALAITNKMIVPMGTSPTSELFAIVHLSPSSLPNPEDVDFWWSYDKYLRYGNSFRDVVPIDWTRPPPQFVRYVSTDSSPRDDLPLVLVESFRRASETVRAMHRQNAPRLILVRTHLDPMFSVGPDKYKIEAGPVVGWGWPRVFDLTNAGLTGPIVDQAIALSVAAGLQDHQTLIFGDLPLDLYTVLSVQNNLGYLISQDSSWSILSPRYARKWVNYVANHTLRGQGNEAIASIPKRVLLSSPLDRAILTQVETPVVLQDNKLKLVLI